MTPPRPARRLRAPLAALLATGLLLTGCAGDTDRRGTGTPQTAAPTAPAAGTGTTAGAATTAGPSPTGSTGAQTAETLPALPPPPRVGDCHRLGYRALTRPTSTREPVPCGKRHTTVTIHVGRLDTVVDGHALAVDSELVQQRLTDACPSRLAPFVGGTAERRALSQFEVVWFRPSVPQSDLGATWFRCDLVALAGPERLAELPGPRALRGVLGSAAGLDDFGLCGTAAPGSPSFQRVICARPHSWQAVATIPLAGGDRYPGSAKVRRAGDADCRDLVQRRAGAADEFRYGWEWPTRDQWRRGQRYGFCWAES